MGAGASSTLGRREILRAFGASAAVALLGREVRAEPAPEEPPTYLDVQELVLPGDPRLARRALVFTPKLRATARPPPVLVLLHGLGETWDEKIGQRAWSERYGLVSADARLRCTPLALPAASRYLSTDRVDHINAELSVKPYHGAVLVCPFTPNIHKLPPERVALDHYADWITGTLLPAVRSATPARDDAAGTAIDGCSLGGYMALEVFLRKPRAFGAVGGLQPAISERMAPLYAQLLRKAIERVGPRAIHIETSSWDPEIKGHEALSKGLDQLKVPHDYDVLPGGHDQIFLRERGTLEMLLWHDRRFLA